MFRPDLAYRYSKMDLDVIDKYEGSYTLDEPKIAYKGLRYDDYPLLAKMVIPKGATVIVPKDPDKFRVDTVFVADFEKMSDCIGMKPSGPVLNGSSPVRITSCIRYWKWCKYSVGNIDTNVFRGCGPGIHLCMNKSNAKEWAMC